MEKVTGIGGIFFKSANPERLRAWYRDHLGIPIEDWGGAVFQWREEGRADGSGSTVWSPFAGDTTYFAPSTAPFMINYRVANLDRLLEQLRAAGAAVEGGPDDTPHGRFGWVMDPDGNKIELWQPSDA